MKRSPIAACRNWLPILALVWATGCVNTSALIARRDAVPAPAVNQVHTYWENRVVVTQDTVNGGVPLAGLAGRLYFFGAEVGHPFRADGTVTIDLADATNLPPGQQAQRLERWQFDNATLQRLVKRDTIGHGYTLFLPWKTYRPDITRVQLNVQFTPANGGNPIYAPPSMVTIRPDGTIPITSRQVTAPVQQAGAKGGNQPR